MSEHVVIIRDNGDVVFLDNETLAPFQEIGKSTTRRASHVEPVNYICRIAFNILRYCFGDKGFMAKFTRVWPCLWRVNLSPTNGPILSNTYIDRQEAIEAEIAYLNEHLE